MSFESVGVGEAAVVWIVCVLVDENNEGKEGEPA